MSGTDFWSRRKASVEIEAKVAIQSKEMEETAVLEAEQAEKTDEELLLELDLPNPDDMRMGDDFSAFMSKAVPDRLRRRALRRLWLANPALANLDGLLDYGEDFTDSATVIENMQTAYQVGKGMTEHVLEMVRQAEEEAAKQLAAVEADTQELASGEIAAVEDADSVALEPGTALNSEKTSSALENQLISQTDTSQLDTNQPAIIWHEYYDTETDDSVPAMLPKRRMAFHFDDMKEPQL